MVDSPCLQLIKFLSMCIFFNVLFLPSLLSVLVLDQQLLTWVAVSFIKSYRLVKWWMNRNMNSNEVWASEITPEHNWCIKWRLTFWLSDIGWCINRPFHIIESIHSAFALGEYYPSRYESYCYLHPCALSHLGIPCVFFRIICLAFYLVFFFVSLSLIIACFSFLFTETLYLVLFV